MMVSMMNSDGFLSGNFKNLVNSSSPPKKYYESDRRKIQKGEKEGRL